MNILFDHNTPNRLAPHLKGHEVTKAKERGWDRLENGDLLVAAEKAGFHLLLTADKNMRYQQNLSHRKIALIDLGKSPWPLVTNRIPEILAAVNAATVGGFADVDIPLPLKEPFVRPQD